MAHRRFEPLRVEHFEGAAFRVVRSCRICGVRLVSSQLRTRQDAEDYARMIQSHPGGLLCYAHKDADAES